ncbi:MAG: SEC-C metal-binding domain-containing protein [bacterium]
MNQTPTNDHQSQTNNNAQADHGPVHVHGPGCNHGHNHSDATPYVRSAPKVGPNDTCPCGSGKKFKKCCR